jgi:hypothetical protein
MESNIEIEREKIRKSPYSYICEDWAEASLPYVGKKTFSIASLMPCSLILPDIPMGSKVISPRINLFEISGSGTGKSSKADKFEKIAYYPLKRRIISGSELQQRAFSMEMLSIIIEDMSQFCSEYERVKILEGCVGEESEIGKSNMRVELVGKVRALAMLFGTPIDIERYVTQLEGGLMSRCVLSIIYLSPKEHAEIGRFVNNSAGDQKFSDMMALREQAVIEYYQELKKIQTGENQNIPPVISFNIPKEFKDEVYEKWSRLSDKLIRDLGEKSYVRDLNYYYKFLASSAFLNIYNRIKETKDLGIDKETKEMKKGTILHPNVNDHQLAIKLMMQNMRNKWALDKAISYKRNIKTLEMLKNILQSEKTSEVKNILMNISPMARFMNENNVPS